MHLILFTFLTVLKPAQTGKSPKKKWSLGITIFSKITGSGLAGSLKMLISRTPE